MDPFVDADYLASMLGRSFSNPAQVTVLLEQASDHLRSLIGQNVTAGTTTYTEEVDVSADRLLLPQQPVRAVTAVVINGQTASGYKLQAGRLVFDRWSTHPLSHLWYPGCAFGMATVRVTFDHGVTEAPGDLKTWTCTLASQALAQIEAFGSAGSSGLRSREMQVGNTTETEQWASMGEGATAFSIPQDVVDNLRARYGLSAYVMQPR